MANDASHAVTITCYGCGQPVEGVLYGDNVETCWWDINMRKGSGHDRCLKGSDDRQALDDMFDVACRKVFGKTIEEVSMILLPMPILAELAMQTGWTAQSVQATIDAAIEEGLGSVERVARAFATPEAFDTWGILSLADLCYAYGEVGDDD